MFADIQVREYFFHACGIAFDKHQLRDFQKTIVKCARLGEFALESMMHHVAEFVWEGITDNRNHTVGTGGDERQRDCDL